MPNDPGATHPLLLLESWDFVCLQPFVLCEGYATFAGVVVLLWRQGKHVNGPRKTPETRREVADLSTKSSISQGCLPFW